MVGQVLLGDAEVLERLLVARLEGAFAGPAVEQRAGGVGAPLPQGRAAEGTEVAVLLLQWERKVRDCLPPTPRSRRPAPQSPWQGRGRP